jgi:4-hydroxythreonine-4-phosphate dehydrogenase
MISRPPRIVLTAGEPAGIGADLCIQLAQEILPACELVVLADAELLQQRAKQLDLPLTLHHFDSSIPRHHLPKGHLTILPVALKAPVQAGVLNYENSGYVLELLDRAIDGCLNKKAIYNADFSKVIVANVEGRFKAHHVPNGGVFCK